MKTLKNKRIFLILFVVLSVSLLFTVIASADTGSKPSIEIIIKNAPENYYLDLLVNEEPVYENLHDQQNYDKAMLSVLKNYKSDGWHPGLTVGTTAPMTGKLTGEKSGTKTIHSFGYIGVPDNFKIITVTPDGQTRITEEICRNTFQTVVVYDFSTNQVSVRTFMRSVLVQFSLTLAATLIVETIVLLLFRFSIARNWKPFLLINISTQILMTLVVGSEMIKDGLLSAYYLFFPISIIVAMIEIAAINAFFKQYGKKRRTLFAIASNAANCAAGYLLLRLAFTLNL